MQQCIGSATFWAYPICKQYLLEKKELRELIQDRHGVWVVAIDCLAFNSNDDHEETEVKTVEGTDHDVKGLW